MLVLNYIKRNIGENKEGMLKSVFYGEKQKSQPIFVNEIEFQKIYRDAGESTIISLNNIDNNEKLQALIQDVQFDPVKNKIIHIDFHIIDKSSKIHANIPLIFVGESEAVKSFGGNLVKVIHEISVEADAEHLPQNISVDISVLNTLDSVIHIKDIKLPDGVKLYHMNENDIVASIVAQKEEDLSSKDNIDISSIENSVEKGKKDKDVE